MSETVDTSGMGWIPDLPDFRDYTIERTEVTDTLKDLGQVDSVKVMLHKIKFNPKIETLEGLKTMKLATSVDLRSYCSPIEDQGNLGSCTAHAGVGIVEYFERRAFGKHIDASKLFLYKVTRNLLQWTGDRGAYLRTTIAALRLFGVPPERYWRYIISNFDVEPSAFVYSYAQNFQAISYFRLDPPGISRQTLLARIKQLLAAKIPSMFGFTVFSSINQASRSGKIPFPTSYERVRGGHAIVAVGYDNNIEIKNTNMFGGTTKGALLIRNSWGRGWGDNGYGWLPYKYVLSGLAVDWWSLLRNEWINTGQFGLP